MIKQMMLIFVFAGSSVQATIPYKNSTLMVGSMAPSAAVGAGGALAAYKLSKIVFDGILNSSLLPQDFQNARLIKTVASHLLAGATGITAGYKLFGVASQWLTPMIYMYGSKERLCPGLVQDGLVSLDQYLTYLSILDNLEREFNDLVKKLNSSRYHQSGSPERLILLDGAFYHLKEDNLIADLEKERNYHLTNLQSQISDFQWFIEKETESAELFKHVKDNFEKFLNASRNCSRDEALLYMHANETLAIYHALSEFYTHMKLFNKGFNEGINVIDEAYMINQLGHRLLEKLSFHLEEQSAKMINYITQLERIAKIETFLKNRVKISLKNL